MRVTDKLKAQCLINWSGATDHDFCKELAAGTLPLNKMRRYLIEDYAFIDSFIHLAGKALYLAPTLADRLPLARFLGVISGPENTYFERSFKALEVPPEQVTLPTLSDAANGMRELMLEAAETDCYANLLAVLVVAEWSYLSWASTYYPPHEDLPFYFAEWIQLHAVPEFAEFVDWLRSQLDREFDLLDAPEQQVVINYFERMVAQERTFFDAVYSDQA